MNKKLLFNDNWMFTKQQIGVSVESLQLKDTIWKPVDLPHDWLIYNTKDLYETSEGWYRKSFILEDIGGQVFHIRFEGVYMDSTVFVNGSQVGEWKYGYSTFEFDITDYLKEGQNEIMVRVVHQAPNSRWYSGAGIYRNVWLKVMNPLQLVSDGIYISTVKSDNGWFVDIETEAILRDVQNSWNSPVKALIRHRIVNGEGDIIAEAENPLKVDRTVSIDKQKIFVAKPNLWDMESPYLYTLETELVADDKITHTEVQRFGFRSLHFDPQEGFFLNDRHVKLYGACQHHDLGALGAAVNKVALKRQLEILQEMGVNAIRTSHNMPAVELMDLADEMGILIVSEAFDMWELKKTEYDYARFFNEWCERDVASWVRRDRNHPSIIMWSIGNEIYDTQVKDRGLEITKLLKQYVLTHDPKGNGHVTIGSNHIAGENTQICANELIVVGYNYKEFLYEEHHKKYPHWCIYGSETASNISSRGIYHFPADTLIVTHEDKQCSSLDNCSVSWGAKNAQQNIIDDRDAKYSLGQFIWTGFDYIGEPTPYTTKNSYFGQIDTAGFKKDSFYLYQAEWTDYKKKPMVHILPYWDFNEGQLIDIRIYSNAPKTELFFNDKSLGTFDIDHINGKQLSGKWQIPYKPGTIKAVAYDEEGNIIATDEKRSFGDPAKIILTPDKTGLQADGTDLIFVEIKMQDAEGVDIDNANNRVEVEVTGAGRLVGLDNGDSTDYDQYKGTSRRLFSGKLLAIIAAKLEPGDIKVKVSSIGLPDATLNLKALPTGPVTGVSALTENVKSEANHEVPIRKIELTCKGDRHLNPDNLSVNVEAKLYPSNTTYTDILWKAVNVGGIETNIAKIEVEGNVATVSAVGDGEFRLRCTANNGAEHPQIISELEFKISGMGAATINPYQMVDARLYSAGNYKYETGMIGGIVTHGNSTNHVSFDLDFGDYGSDEVTLPIYSWDANEIPVEIWSGIPGEEGAEILLNTQYKAKRIWETFQANTFKLPKRLKGVNTITFVFYNRITLKGFEFTYYDKAYAQISVKEDRNQIYGDSFQISEDAISKIGNNVTIEFNDMDFGQEGCTGLLICGRTRNESNTISILFSNEDGTVTRNVEFTYSEEYKEMEFKLEKITGNQKVSFVFLPGSNFDFKWFKFLK